MIDTHSHIYLPDFDKDRKEVLDRAASEGIKAICMPAIDFNSIKQMEVLHHKDISFYRMAGIHPCDIEELSEDFELQLYEFCNRRDIVGVGETGLDYYWNTDFVEAQKKSLKSHCRVAKSVNKPVILHNRESTMDLLDLIETEQNGNLTGIWHCFNGTVEEGKRAIDLGLLLGIGGVVTFKNGGVDKTVAELPLDRMVLETDAPYLSPTPKRGRRNEPSFMKYTAVKLAEIFEINLEQLVQITSKTASSLFSIEI